MARDALHIACAEIEGCQKTFKGAGNAFNALYLRGGIFNMSRTIKLAPVELRRAGWKALKKELGITDALKFILQYEKGEGDYTEERREFFKNETVKSLLVVLRI